MGAKEPGGAHDEAAAIDQSSRPLARELGPPVGVDRIGVVGLAVWSALPVEDVVGRRVDQLCTDLLSRARDESGALTVDHRGLPFGLLRTVDVGPRRAVDDGARALSRDQ